MEPEVWEFQISGYQVLHKWLKDRKGRELSFDDLFHYQKIVVALKGTVRIMGDVDALIPQWPIEWTQPPPSLPFYLAWGLFGV